MSRKSVEWQFFDTDTETEWRKQTLAAQRVDQNINGNRQETSHLPKKTYYVYELLTGIALLYGIAIYLLWQQTTQNVEQRIELIEHEVVALQDELSAYRQAGVETKDAVAPKESFSTLPYHFETTYLHFEVSPRTNELVQTVAPWIDAKYEQLHREVGVVLNLSSEKFIIIIDPATNGNYPFSDEQTLVAAHPKFAAKQYGISESEALTTELFARLAHRLIRRAVERRAIKPQWQGMTLALKAYIRLENGFNHNWQENEIFLRHRYNAQSRPLDLVHEMILSYEPDLQHEPSSQASPTAFETANPLVEFILATYGYTKVPALLDAFEEHDSWETLAPNLFHLSASKFEAQWHAYLRTHYPIPE